MVAIQKFCLSIQNCPALILTCIFETLLWEEIIEENVFLKWKQQADEKSIDLSKEFFYKLTSAKLKEKPKEEAKPETTEQAKTSPPEKNSFQYMNMNMNMSPMQHPVQMNYFLQSQPQPPPSPLMPNFGAYPGVIPNSYPMHFNPAQMINMMNNPRQASPNPNFHPKINNRPNFQNNQKPYIRDHAKKENTASNHSTHNLNKNKTVCLVSSRIYFYFNLQKIYLQFKAK